MFQSQNILYITHYHEKKDKEPKSRYLVVLHADGEKTLILSTTTTNLRVPDELQDSKGCVVSAEHDYHAYVFTPTCVIGNSGFCFPEHCCVHVQWDVFFKNPEKMKQDYEQKGKVGLIDVMSKEVFTELIYCIYKSDYLPYGAKKFLESVLEQLHA